MQVSDKGSSLVLFKNFYLWLTVLSVISFLIYMSHPGLVSTFRTVSFIGLKKSSTERPPLILFWTKWFNQPPPYLQIQHDLPCFRKRCYIIHHERHLLPISDAVIFHSGDLRPNDLPSERREDQVWIFMEQESPVLHDRQDLKSGKYDNFFNWTFTYRRDSDVPIQYMVTTKLENEMDVPFNYSQLKEKSKPVAWLVSHCPTNSRREDYVAELGRHISVDIYGKCGPLICPGKRYDCMPYVGRKYWFYLSFENAKCHDYVTEKLLNPLQNDLVPVVMGGADYDLIAPPGSYINVDDFNSPKDLAKYLLYLINNTEEYIKYFSWRNKYTVFGTLYSETGLCALCDRLIAQVKNPRKKTYKNLWEWWYFKGFDNKTKKLQPACKSPNFKFN